MLTIRQEKFVQELVKGKSQRQAYKAAYNCSRWKDKTVDETACKLLKHPKVYARYEELRHEAESKAADDATSVRAKILDAYARIAFADVKAYYHWGKGFAGQDELKVRPDVMDMDGTPIKSITYDARGNLKLEFYDKIQAMDKLRELYDLRPQNDDAIVVKLQGDLERYSE